MTVREAEAALERLGPDLPDSYLRPNGYLLDVVLHGSADNDEPALAAVRRAFGRRVYAIGSGTLASALLADFRRLQMTISAAESCTGGRVGAALTAVPGASDVFWGGVVAYDDAAKVRLLGVPEAMLARHGAVSEEVAVAMARGVREIAGTTWSVAVTGIAGPSGGTAAKPVGTVWIATAGPREGARLFEFAGGRRTVRRRSTQAALDMLRLAAGADGP